MPTPMEPTSSYRPEDFDTIMGYGLGDIDRRTITAYIERLEAIIDTIAESVIEVECDGGELFPVGPVDIEYERDDKTITRIVRPWTWLHVGRGDTFIEAIENYRAATKKG